MKIDRQRAAEAFAHYVEAYDSKDEKVRLKIEHTDRVSGLCEIIAKSLQWKEQDVDLAWLIGLLHDIGRFEQLKNHGTFNDEQSINHAEYGADILFKQGRIWDYITKSDTTKWEERLIWNAINYHNAYRIPENLDETTKLFCHIIRDADKIDILKVNVEFPLEEIYNVTSEELREGQVTKEVLESFYEEHAVLRTLKKSPVDHVVGHISLVYELVYPISIQLVDEQGNLKKLMDFQSNNPITMSQFVQIRDKMNDYIYRRGNQNECKDDEEQGKTFKSVY